MPEPPTPTLHPSAARGQALLGDGRPPAPAPPRPKPRLKKLRLGLIIVGLGCLAAVSTVFGMLMAVASDLPALENTREFRSAENSLLYQDGPGCREPGRRSCQIAKLTGNQNRILANQRQISPYIKNAVIAIEDRRYYEHEGVDYVGIGRALWQDILRRSAVQGGSTITQQFVKNALSAQGDRSVFQKLREAALSYHLEREWSKDKILTQYLNTVYFGNGAYGIEAAVRTYFGDGDEDEDVAAPDDELNPVLREAIDVAPAQAALLAGMIASPGLYDPVQNPKLAKQRRNLVLDRMLEQRTITRAEYEEAIDWRLPTEDQVDPPDVESEQPYFTTWLTQQLVDRYGPGVVFGGGLKVKTTIDPTIQQAAEDAAARVSGVGPDVSLVAVENKTGEVKAMVGGSDFDVNQFNLATNGHRQPGSAMKPFILVRALQDGVDPNSTWASQPKEFPVPGSKKEVFPVSNYEDSYSGVASLWSATATSDNSVFAELGLQTGTKRIARLAQTDGNPHPAVHQPRHDAGRPQGGRDTPRDGLRLLDDRQQGPAGVGDDGAGQQRAGGHCQGGRQRIRGQEPQADAAGVRRAGRSDRTGHALAGGEQRNRQGRPGLRRGHLGQDRDHRELRRRLVRGIQRRADGGRLGGLRGKADPHGVRVRRQSGGGRHVSRGDLRQLHGLMGRNPRSPRGGLRQDRGRQ